MESRKSYGVHSNPLVTIFPYPLHKETFHKPNPKQNSYAMYLNVTGALSLVSLLYNFILNGINLENWKSILGLIASVFFIAMWGIGKVKDMKHKSKMRKFEYDRERIKNERLQRLNIEEGDEEKTLGI